jgi:putative ABC transport system permease protein
MARTLAPALARLALSMRLLRAEWSHHPWRQAAAAVAVGLGVALAFAVHLINASALAEFDAAVHAAGGAPDFSVRPRGGATLPEALYPRVARAPGVAQASPVVEVGLDLHGADGRPHPARLLGLDALIAPRISPGWLPRPEPAADAALEAALDPDRVFVNAAARALIGEARTVALQAGARVVRLAVGGRIDADGPPLLVMDIAGAQTHFDRLGALSRIDVRLAPGARAEAVMAAVDAGPEVRAAAPDEAVLRMARLSQSYRVNLGVLSLVALFTGGFLVFSVQSLAVAKRVPQLALLGVLGMDGRQRGALVRLDSLVIGILGSALGLALGTGLAAAALRTLGGDLGNGAPAGAAPPLAWSAAAAAAYAALGVASALAGGAQPARAARRIAPAQSLKGLSEAPAAGRPAAAGLALIALAAVLARVPPWHAIPWAAYACVGVLLLGGIGLVPACVAVLLRGLRGLRHPVVALAVARAIDQRRTAAAAVAGVVASLSLVVALTVMVASFRDSLAAWLDDVLPADLYVRPAPGAGDAPPLLAPPVAAAARAALGTPGGVARLRGERLVPVLLSPDQPEALLIARDAPAPGAPPDVPWIVRPAPPAMNGADRAIPVYASEILAALQHLRPGDAIALPLPAAPGRGPGVARAVVRGIWRDYARQQGALLMDRADWLRLTGDDRVSGLALWRAPGGDPASLAAALARAAPADAPVDVATSAQLRALSLRIFDRSFAVTRWLRGVALAIGLAGVAASFSAQVLARRREFAMLRHLGFTRRQVLALVACEGALWSAAGAVLGLALGWAVSVVLVEIVNPQSFHWTMRMSVPAGPLALLALGVVAAGACTSWISGRAAAGRDLVRAVQEDW